MADMARGRIPLFQFEKDRSEQSVVGQTGDGGGFSDRTDEAWRIAAFGCPVNPVMQFVVGAGAEHGESPQIWAAYRDPNVLAARWSTRMPCRTHFGGLMTPEV